MSASSKKLATTFMVAVVATIAVKLATKHIPQVNQLLN